MSATAYKRILLTGGTADALDSVDGVDLNTGDFAFVMVEGVGYSYLYKDYGSPQSESTPDIIVPDSNPGNFAWQLQDVGFNVGVISSDTILYLAVDGDDDTGDGTSGSPWYSLEQAFDYLKDKWINTDVTVTISIGSGTFSDLASVTMNHPNLNCIDITGAGKDITILLFAGEGIIVKRSMLDVLEKLTIKGSSTGSYNGLTVISGSVVVEDVKFSTWKYCVYFSNNSYFSITDGDFYNFQWGVYCIHSIIDLDANLNGNDVSNSVGIYAHRNTILVTTGSMQLTNMAYGISSSYNSFVDASGISINTATNPYSPTVTTSSSAEPTWGNWGSWIKD